MFSVSSALERALPLVYQRGALLHPAGQEKALRPASSAFDRPQRIIIKIILVELPAAALDGDHLLAYQKPPV